MNRRFPALAVCAAALVAFVVAAVPALGDDRVAPSFDRAASSAALAKAKRAITLARQARRDARIARTEATGADYRANDARTRAVLASVRADEDHELLTAARSRLDAMEVRLAKIEAEPRPIDGIGESSPVSSATVPGLASSSSPSGEFEALGGPQVQVVVPSSGLIEVWAQVAINDDEGGGVGLFEDGQEVDGVSEPELCGDDSVVIDASGGGPGNFVVFATPPVPGLVGCGSAGAPAPILLKRQPGIHTYELRYAQCSCGGAPAEFKDRVLRVAPRP
ncbi:MAG: hypothetical protein ABW065_07700 [Solirubrobacterales bacterium]